MKRQLDSMEINFKEEAEKCDKINLTQLILNFLNRYQERIEYNKFKKILLNIGNQMAKEINSEVKSTKSHYNFHENFKMINEQYLSNELWYWISNDFIKKQYKPKGQSDIEKPFLELTQKAKDDIPKYLEENINWNLSKKTKSYLEDIIDLIISKMNKE